MWDFYSGTTYTLERPASRPARRLGVSSGRATRFHSAGQTRGNAFIESFNGRLRDECLNVQQFVSIADAQTKIEAWRLDYNQRRPHSSLGHLTSTEFIAQRQAMQDAKVVAGF